jgi:5-methylcytosine-specific restriction endonuclease McrA
MMPLDGPAVPDPKPARVPSKPYRRKVASRKQWARIAAEKTGPCRVCGSVENGRMETRIQLHHLVPRSRGGDDQAENIVPLCQRCHELVTIRDPQAILQLAENMQPEEIAYLERKISTRHR